MDSYPFLKAFLTDSYPFLRPFKGFLSFLLSLFKGFLSLFKAVLRDPILSVLKAASGKHRDVQKGKGREI